VARRTRARRDDPVTPRDVASTLRAFRARSAISRPRCAILERVAFRVRHAAGSLESCCALARRATHSARARRSGDCARVEIAIALRAAERAARGGRFASRGGSGTQRDRRARYAVTISRSAVVFRAT
jgi:hypothetical protein